MLNQIVQLKKGEFQLDFIEVNESKFTSATNFANYCGMDAKYVNRIINEDEFLKNVSQKFTIRDAKSNANSMVCVNNTHFLYFLTKVRNIKVRNVAPDFVKRLIIIYPLFLVELAKRVHVMHERMEQNRIDQLRIIRLARVKAFCISEMKKLADDIKERNIEDINFNMYDDGSEDMELNFDDRFERKIIEIDIVE